ncbi:S8 family serine peptidase [Candidatus Syntrophosphaera thermopropionivorans]|uniref:T9SS type A sorting domain-containing protein n=1 Tax=Candidatus Syntrophosphaera thermopropionivorans TaxID=2593015 RepID=A0AC61QKN4_9BACT|nr:S8 family serine peptidase [Candidatus Syntrophosphaera thermopropionivorans]TDF74217.1 T9SS type A sorting domain-containing protein [Candidatus Syntrophosphaera thermopropionivorans]
MRKCYIPFLFFFLISLTVLSALEYTPGQLIFKTSQPLNIKSDQTGITSFDNWLSTLGAYNLRPIKGMPNNQYFFANLEQEPNWKDLKEGKIKFAGIEYIQPNYLSTFHTIPNDPLFPRQYHTIISNPQAWDYCTGSSTVVVGIVDSGCLINHPDLAANIWVNTREIPDNGIDDDNNGYIDDIYGWDFVDAPELADIAIGDYLNPDNNVEDENFHGTAVAGIIGGVGNNGVGICGVNWNIKLMIVRSGFLTVDGQGYLQDDDAAAALIYAADNGCNVINMSWGDPNYSPIIGDACAYAYSRGVTLVASAGNDPGPYISYPAKLSTAISVGAINRTRTLAGFSSYGPDLDLVAPGEMVLSTYKLDPGNQYYEQSGTSMSAPFVSGAAALLLSLHPGLSPSEVRSRLLTATDDLGAPGFDQYYGHGLLNAKRLLENTAPPLVYIDSPLDQSGLTESFDIIGTVQGNNFFRYSVMYSNKSVPSLLDWYDVETHHNYPKFHTQPVQNGVLAHFYIPESFAEGEYIIRVQYEAINGSKYNFFRTVIYDPSPPQMKENSLQQFTRYDKQNLRYYIIAVFNEPVRSELDIIASNGTHYHSYGAMLDTLQIWSLPETLPEGQIDIQVKATNVSNLTFLSDWYNGFLNIHYELIPNYGYIYSPLGGPKVPLNYSYDYNGDGIKEYIAMDLPKTGYGPVYAYQPEAGGHIVSHSFGDSFWLLGAGNTNNIGQELLTLKYGTATVLESQNSSYPNIALWEDRSIDGGTIADYSNDGIDDLLLVKTLPTERVIQAYKRSGNIFVPKNTLHNTSSTTSYNAFVPTIIVKNFDNDSYPDILVADTDGDVMIYEIRNDNFAELTWTQKMPVGNTYYLTSGDFDGNGRQDFFIGGYYTDKLDPNLNFWYFEGFKNVSNNNYTSMGSIMFNQVASKNAIQAADLDNDGKDEIILAISPNLYIVKYQDSKFQPQFYGNSYNTYSILAYIDHPNQSFFLTNYEVEKDSLISVVWTQDAPYTGPPTPINFIARPLNESSVQLSWINNGADYYRIYRKEENNQIYILDNVTGNSYIDLNVEEGCTYQYAITAYNSNFTPSESAPTIWQTVIPYPVPHIESVTMIGPNRLRVMFDQPMATSICNPSLYTVDKGMSHPSSVNYINYYYGVQLQFSQIFPETSEPFLLTLGTMLSAYNIPLAENQYEFYWIADTEPPKVTGAVVLNDQKTVEITFSESLAPDNPSPEQLHNYTLICHSNDPDNSIVSVSHLDDRVQVSLSHKLKFGSSPYQIVVRNVRDLAGNPIIPQYSTTRFYMSNNHDLKNLVVYPNPVRFNDLQCHILNFPAGKRGHIKIYDSSGNLVRSSAIGPFNPEINNIDWIWDLKNNDGKLVSSGIYFYVVEMGGNIARGKIAIIK